MADTTKRLELWGGAECTVNRVGDTYCDQTVLTGRQLRLDDIERFAELGLRAFRLPVLWERVAPEAPDRCDWSWSDDQLARLRAAGVRAIAGLVHHGAGPAYASLLEEEFAPGLAEHARRTAERYPWVDAWTPVNEPLTTARFSALYGHWHPHLRDERSFWLALLNEIDATRLAMAEIRRVNPEARLIQTDDLGHTYATAPLADQAAFDNGRRWISWDLLCGRVVQGHPFYERLAGMGFGDRLRAIADDPCPPDVVGVNHYLTSDRLLDERWDRYPAGARGGNGRQTYADVEAVRALVPGPAGLEGVLQETWERYRIPVAVTESHNGCTRDEQVRWLWEAWETASALRARGAQVVAVTAWSLMGAHYWDCLLTNLEGGYEPGAFDLRAPTPRPTRLARLMAELGHKGGTEDAIARSPGWWRRDIRLVHAPVFRRRDDQQPASSLRPAAATPQPILIVGATGTLGQAIARACQWRGLPYVLCGRAELDIAGERSISRMLDAVRPWALINAAGYVRVDDAELEPDACRAVNALGAVRLARASGDRKIRYVAFSSDLVFDGLSGRAYVESDAPNPLCVYGASKAEAEAGVLAAGAGEALMVRTSAFFSPFDRFNFAHHVVNTLRAARPFTAADDLVISPTYVPDLADATLDLLLDEERGLWHLANEGAVSWAGFATMIAEACGLDPALVRPMSGAELGFRALRPPQVALASERGWIMPSLESAISRFADAVQQDPWRSTVDAAPVRTDARPRARSAPPISRPRSARRVGEAAPGGS